MERLAPQKRNGLGWIRLDWTGLAWIGLDWIGLVLSVGLDWLRGSGGGKGVGRWVLTAGLPYLRHFSDSVAAGGGDSAVEMAARGARYHERSARPGTSTRPGVQPDRELST